ncbi:exported protein of unknown function [Rhodovastum atsumiense]|nr:exported protein of unknown function [Rhodovastum atsumiense]
MKKLAPLLLGGLWVAFSAHAALAQWYPPPPDRPYADRPYARPRGYYEPPPRQYGPCGPYMRPYYPPPYYGAQWVCGHRSGQWHWR